MPEIEVKIGGRGFQVACQEGEEHFLRAAASLLDNEAQTLAGALGRVPETRMLLMAGLMLADKTAGLEEELRAAERQLAEANARNSSKAAPAAPKEVEVRVEVPVIPAEVKSALSDVASRTEALAAEVEAAVSS